MYINKNENVLKAESSPRVSKETVFLYNTKYVPRYPQIYIINTNSRTFFLPLSLPSIIYPVGRHTDSPPHSFEEQTKRYFSFAYGVVNLWRPWYSTSSDYFSPKMKIKTFGFCGDYQCPFIILFSAELIFNGPPFFLGRPVFDLES